MAKQKTAYFCKECGAQHSKWFGQCPQCRAWNSIIEEVISVNDKIPAWGGVGVSKNPKPLNILEIDPGKQPRISTGDYELDRVLGGGLVPGSLVLLGGEPGIGKSTLMLQIALKFSEKALYVSGEESLSQVKMRGERIGIRNENCFILSETATDNIFKQIENVKPNLLIVDSIQTLQSACLESAPGTISQIKETAAELLRFAKQSGVPVILIGHITKDGSLAGPKILEHMVDCVLQFEGDRNHIYRIVRAGKNRFGSTSEIGIYEMKTDGLEIVDNPSAALISQENANLSGNAIAVTLEGARPILIEVQALVSSAVYGTPQRSATGYDTRRLNMLLAVLEKRVGFKLGVKDVFLNITGGIRVEDPALDLAVIAAVLSSNLDMAVGNSACFAAEVGLSGEIRPVTRIEQRIAEAQKLGFGIIFVSKFNKADISKYKDIRIIEIERIEQLVKFCFA